MSESADQQLVYERMRERLLELFGPGGSFRVTLGRAGLDEGFFAATIAETVAWEVASAVGATEVAEEPHRHAAAIEPQAEHEALWAHVEEQLLIRSTGPDAFLDDIDLVATPEHLDEQPAHAGSVRAA